MSFLIPSRQIAFSIELASTLGLEEAILLQCLSDQGAMESALGSARASGRYQWHSLKAQDLLALLPFWKATDIQRIAENLRQQGVILISSAPLGESGEIRYAFNEDSQPARPAVSNSPEPHNPAKPQAGAMAPNWRPDEHALRLLAQQGVPNHFAHDQIAEFVHYWSERGEARHSWGNRFVSHVLRKWRDFEARQSQSRKMDTSSWDQPRENEPKPMSREWRPSTDALEILEIQAGIHRNFIEDAIPEFILYWSEKGDQCNTWNARFINHVKRQWAEYQHTLKNESRPTVMTADWQPSDDVYDVLRIARIDTKFAQELVPEFVMYWRDRNEMRPSWNTLFLQFAKKQWQQRNLSENSLRDRSIVEDLSDRSWAT